MCAHYGQLYLRSSTTLVQLLSLSLSCSKRKSRIYWLNESLGLQPWNNVLNFAEIKASRGSTDFFHSWIQHILPYKEIALWLYEDKWLCGKHEKMVKKFSLHPFKTVKLKIFFFKIEILTVNYYVKLANAVNMRYEQVLHLFPCCGTHLITCCRETCTFAFTLSVLCCSR